MRKPPSFSTYAERVAYYTGRADALREAAVTLADLSLEVRIPTLRASVVVDYLLKRAQSADESLSLYTHLSRVGAA